MQAYWVYSIKEGLDMKRARQVFAGICAIALCAAACGQRAATAAELQWGFDSIVGAVATVANDGTGGATLAGEPMAGRGGLSYSFDTPLPTQVQNVTGIGSVDFFGTNGTLRTSGTVSNLATDASLIAAGGITLQAWYRQTATPQGGAGIGGLIDVGGAMLLRETGSGFSVLVNSSGLPTPSVAVSQANKQNQWNHLAAIWATNGTTHTLSLYLNGVLAQSLAHPQVPVLNAVGGLPITVGGRFADNLFDTEGLIYEPVVTLGVVPRSQFTIAIPEPATLAISALSVLGLVATRRRLSV